MVGFLQHTRVLHYVTMGGAVSEYGSVNFQYDLSKSTRRWPNCDPSGHTEEKPLYLTVLLS